MSKYIPGYVEREVSGGVYVEASHAWSYNFALLGETDLYIKAFNGSTVFLNITTNGHSLYVKGGPEISQDGIYALHKTGGYWVKISSIESDSSGDSEGGNV